MGRVNCRCGRRRVLVVFGQMRRGGSRQRDPSALDFEMRSPGSSSIHSAKPSPRGALNIAHRPCPKMRAPDQCRSTSHQAHRRGCLTPTATVGLTTKEHRMSHWNQDVYSTAWNFATKLHTTNLRRAQRRRRSTTHHISSVAMEAFGRFNSTLKPMAIWLFNVPCFTM